MQNYGEELSYWYLRLNGFFPLANFVMHGARETKGRFYTTDCDVLAIRPPYVEETIVGQELAFDRELQNQCGDGNRMVGLICQTKTGRYTSQDLFDENDVRYAVKRLGVCNPDAIDNCIKDLGEAVFSDLGDNTRVIKLLIANQHLTEGTDKYLFLSISHITDFIKHRISEYRVQKNRDRLFFPSSLLQYFIDQAAKGPAPRHSEQAD